MKGLAMFGVAAMVFAATGCAHDTPTSDDSMSSTLEQAKKDSGVTGNGLHSVSKPNLKAPGVGSAGK